MASSEESQTTNAPIITLPNGIAVRRFQASDVEAQIEHLNNVEVRRFLRNSIPFPYQESDAIWWINHCGDASTWARAGPWKEGITYTATKEAHEGFLPTHYAITKDGIQIGTIGLKLKGDIYFRTAELGYWIGQPYWGKGIMGGVAKAFIEWALATFGVIYRIDAAVMEGNNASVGVLRKAGLKHEGRRDGVGWKNGKILAEDYFAILRQQELAFENTDDAISSVNDKGNDK